MEYYAKGMRKFQRELKISVSEFPRFALLARKIPEEVNSENYWPDNNSNSCEQTQKELEDYRLQELAEDPYRIELEPDLTKEQEEYFRRIRQKWMDLLNRKWNIKNSDYYFQCLSSFILNLAHHLIYHAI
jgi:hypothetical protein